MADASRFPQGVVIDGTQAIARPVGTLIHDTVTGTICRSTNALAPAYTQLAMPGVIGDAGVQTWGTGLDVTFTADGVNLVIAQGAGAGLALFYDNCFTIGDPAAPTQRASFDCGLVTAGQNRRVNFQDIDLTFVGRLYSSVADSTTLTALGAPTAFDVTYAVPQNTLKAGTKLRIRAIVRSIGFNAADTHTYALRMNDGGGADVWVTATAVAAAGIGANGRVTIEGQITFRAAPGAAVGGSGTFLAYSNVALLADAVMGPAAGGVFTFATNAAGGILIDVLATHSANSAGNQSVLESLTVDIG
jgi:hypothetical protein